MTIGTIAMWSAVLHYTFPAVFTMAFWYFATGALKAHWAFAVVRVSPVISHLSPAVLALNIARVVSTPAIYVTFIAITAPPVTLIHRTRLDTKTHAARIKQSSEIVNVFVIFLGLGAFDIIRVFIRIIEIVTTLERHTSGVHCLKSGAYVCVGIFMWAVGRFFCCPFKDVVPPRSLCRRKGHYQSGQ